MLAVDGHDARSPGRRSSLHQLARHDQDFLGRRRHVRAGVDRRERRPECRGARDRDADHIGGHCRNLARRIHANGAAFGELASGVAMHERRACHTETARDRSQCCTITPGDGANQLETIREPGDHVTRLTPDRPGRAKQNDASAGRGVGHWCADTSVRSRAEHATAFHPGYGNAISFR